MFSPVDDRIRVFQKGFRGQGGFVSDLNHYEDPTYLGFYFIFDFDPTQRNVDTGITDNALFAPSDSTIESAQRYLQAIGYPQRAEMLKQFKEGMRFINTKAPYYFQVLEGAPELWKINKKDGFDPYRAKEAVLTISCLESVDLRMTALADLYRKATFDSDNMRMLLPDNLRWFTVEIYIAEIRKFHRVKQIVETNDLQAPIQGITPGDHLEELNDLISVVRFKCSKCEFDFEESFPSEEINMAGDMQMAKQKFKIKVGSVSERNSYKLLNLYLSDFVTVNGSSVKEGSIANGGKFNAEPGPNSIQDDSKDRLGSKINGYDQAINSSSLFNGAISALQSQAQSLGRQLGNLGANTVGGALNRLQSQITGLALGNVYTDRRNQSLTELINGFVGERDQIQPLGREDVYPNAPGSDTTTKTSDNLGNAYR